jgi:hypothetical protein
VVTFVPLIELLTPFVPGVPPFPVESPPVPPEPTEIVNELPAVTDAPVTSINSPPPPPPPAREAPPPPPPTARNLIDVMEVGIVHEYAVDVFLKATKQELPDSNTETPVVMLTDALQLPFVTGEMEVADTVAELVA